MPDQPQTTSPVDRYALRCGQVEGALEFLLAALDADPATTGLTAETLRRITLAKELFADTTLLPARDTGGPR